MIDILKEKEEAYFYIDVKTINEILNFNNIGGKMKDYKPICKYKEECFAKRFGRCEILDSVMTSDKCAFQKRDREYTKGKYYPYNEPSKKGDHVCYLEREVND